MTEGGEGPPQKPYKPGKWENNYVISKPSFLQRIGLGNSSYNQLMKAGFGLPHKDIDQGKQRLEGLNRNALRDLVKRFRETGERPRGVSADTLNKVEMMLEDDPEKNT